MPTVTETPPMDTRQIRKKNLVTKHYVDASGNYLGGFGGIQHDEDDPTTEERAMPSDITAVEVSGPPDKERATWDGTAWVSAPLPARDYTAEYAAMSAEMRAIIELLPGGKTAYIAKLKALILP